MPLPKCSPLLALLLVAWLMWTVSAQAALPAYFFTDFEESGAWKAGPLPDQQSGLHLIQGRGSLLPLEEENSHQVLQLGPSTPFAAVFVETVVLAKAPVVFCDFLVRPAASDEQADAEFFNFGGAILGFFKVGGQGEIRALFRRTAEESVWISTGASFALGPDGLAAAWLRLTVRLHRPAERWDLWINGVPVLGGVRAAAGPAAGLPLWLYGQETQPCLFDDLLITTVEPDILEKMIVWQRQREARAKAAGIGPARPKLVSPAKPPAELRSGQPALQEAVRAWVNPVLQDWKAVLQIGQQTYHEGADFDLNGQRSRLLVYSPQYDEADRPLPGVITLMADAELRPGTDLSRIRWLMAEMKGLNEMGEVYAAGDFSTGLVQSVTIPPAWIKKATTGLVWVRPDGPDDAWWRFRMKRFAEPSPSP